MKQRLNWLKDEGIVYSSLWEPSYFEKMCGRPTPDAVWDYMHSAARVAELQAGGINQIWTHWWKGYGLEFEHQEQQRNRPLIEAAHKRGMRVIAYCTFGTIVPETMEHEVPDCMTWAQVGENGQPASCQVNFQSFRVRPCYNSQAWLDYMKRVTSKALAMGADGIHFDNIGYNAEPDSCRCPTCVAKFREFLASQCGVQSSRTRALGERLFGFHDFSRVRAPWFNRWNQAILHRQLNVSVQKMWARFKVESIRQALGQMADHIRGENRNALVEANAGKGFGINGEYLVGLSPEVNYPQLDLVFNESGGLKVGPHGQLITRTRECKIARAGSVPVILYSHALPEAAEMFAFNPGTLGGGVGAKANAWYHRHKRYQLDAETLADVAVLRHRESLAFNMVDPHAAVITAEQVLIESRIPFDIVWGKHLADLSKYRLLILAGCECLSDEEARHIEAFVRKGGAVLAVGKVGVFDEWRILRRKGSDASIKNRAEMDAALRPKVALHRLFGDAPDKPSRRRIGKGRAAYLPSFDYKVYPSGGPEFWMVAAQHYAMPNNAAEVLDIIDWCLGRQRQFVVESPGRLIVEFTRVGRETVVHLLNIDGETKPARAVVTLRPAQRVRSVKSLCFGQSERPAAVKFEQVGSSVRVELDGVGLHQMLIFRP